MDSLVESNERTLIIFDSVCMGLTECLAMVHSDIKQMGEQRLGLLAKQRQLDSAAAAAAAAAHGNNNETSSPCATAQADTTGDGGSVNRPAKGSHCCPLKQAASAAERDERRAPQQAAKLAGGAPPEQAAAASDLDEPAHLAGLRSLDKRLADSFSQALSMCDQQKSSLVARQLQHEAHFGALHSSASGAGAGGRAGAILGLLLGRNPLASKQSKVQQQQQQRQRRRLESKQAAQAAEEADEQQQLAAMIDDINRQTRLALQYSKQLEAHLLRLEELQARYETQLKTGLAVKGVSQAYLSSSCSAGSSPALAGTLSSHSSSLKRAKQRAKQHQRHTSSLMVNDSSSSLGTQSSRSSLNLVSNWSFSRRATSKPTAATRSPQQQQQQQQLASGEPSLAGQRFVSTISLDRHSRRSKKLLGGLAGKLIAPVSSGAQVAQQQQQGRHAREPSPDYFDYEDQYGQDYASGEQAASGRASQACMYRQARDLYQLELDYYNASPPVDKLNSRPSSQYSYADYGHGPVPTTTGTLASIKLNSLDGANAAQRRQQQGQQQQPNLSHIDGYEPNDALKSAPILLHKSASHSSLKRPHSHHHHKLPLANPCQTVVTNNKTTIKQFLDYINCLESEFESCLGTFMLNIEDIQGFARVCQGDVFEISIKYGEAQKFKTKISVLKDNKQRCDNRQIVFKAKIADIIAIKAYECKGALGKKVLLGNKLCETCDLFTARSQLMTISLNQTGSIKLNLVITWNPLHLVPNPSTSTLSRVVSSQDMSFHLAQKASN